MRTTLWAGILAWCLAAGTAGAQTVSSTTGAIDGKVTDNTGGVLPGVTVTISSPSMMGTRDTVTSDQGAFRFISITPGDYTVTFELTGFSTVKRTDVRVGAGFTASLNIQMNVAGLEENVTVTGASPVVDTSSTKVTTNFDAQTLASLPSGGRDAWALLAESPALKLTRIDVGGSASGTQTTYYAYGTTGQNRPMVEGINSTEGTGAFGNYVDMATFDEVSVNASSNTAETATPGVQMIFVSKTGGNTYHGSAMVNYENRNWQRTNISQAQIDAGLQTGGGLPYTEVNRLYAFRDDSVDIGGFLKRDRLWWYAAYRDLDTEARYTNFPVEPFVTTLKTFSAKGTFQLNKNNKLIGYMAPNVKRQPTRLDAFALGLTGIYNTADASFSQKLTVRLWKGEYDSVINDSVFFEVRVGEYGYDWPDTNYTTAPRYEDLGNNLVTGASRIRELDIWRKQVLGSVSYYKTGWAGSHNFKFGWEIFKEGSQQSEFGGSYNNVVHILRNSAPLEVYLLGSPTQSQNGMWETGLYATDTWRVSDKLSVNLGLRFDRYRNFLPDQTHAADTFFPTATSFAAVDSLNVWNTFAPRIGVTYNLDSGKTVLKANYGRYWWNPGYTLSQTANPNTNVWQLRYAWNDLNGDKVWQQGEQGRLISSQGGLASVTIDPNLKDSYTDEVAGWVEREVIPNLGVRGGFVWRTEKQLYQSYNANQPFSAFNVPVQVRDPGPDGRVGTADDGGLLTAHNLDPAYLLLPVKNVVQNVPGSTDYKTLEITANKRMSNHWSAMMSYTYTASYGQNNTFFDTNFRQNVLPVTPNDLINTASDGRIHYTDYAFKLTGSFEVPFGFKISPVYRFQSGQNFGRTFVATLNYASPRIPAEPLDARRQDNISILDLRVERLTRLPFGRLSPFLDIYNLTNANPIQNTSWSSGTSWLRPLNIVPPMLLRVGVKYDW